MTTAAVSAPVRGTHPLAGLTLTLAEIAERIERRKTEEHAEPPPKTESATGAKPVAREGA